MTEHASKLNSFIFCLLAEFILQRRLIFQEAAVTDQSGKTEADYEKDWKDEQKEFDWIYGNKSIPLFDQK